MMATGTVVHILLILPMQGEAQHTSLKSKRRVYMLLALNMRTAAKTDL